MLHRAGVFPQPHHHCLEVGYGTLGRLAELIDWGVPLDHLHGIELDAQQAAVARRRLPSADLRVGMGDLPVVGRYPDSAANSWAPVSTSDSYMSKQIDTLQPHRSFRPADRQVFYPFGL